MNQIAAMEVISYYDSGRFQVEVCDGARQERQGKGTKAEQGRSGEVQHHVERPEIHEEE